MAAFTTRHYRILAEEIRHWPETIWEGPKSKRKPISFRRIAAEELVRMFKRDNPRFKEDLFLRACDVVDD